MASSPAAIHLSAPEIGSRRDRTGTVLLKALRRRSSATPHNFTREIGPRRRPKGEAKGLSHKRAFEDEGLMAVFQQPLKGCYDNASHSPYNSSNRLFSAA